jgi:hypothetical protein
MGNCRACSESGWAFCCLRTPAEGLLLFGRPKVCRFLAGQRSGTFWRTETPPLFGGFEARPKRNAECRMLKGKMEGPLRTYVGFFLQQRPAEWPPLFRKFQLCDLKRGAVSGSTASHHFSGSPASTPSGVNPRTKNARSHSVHQAVSQFLRQPCPNNLIGRDLNIVFGTDQFIFPCSRIEDPKRQHRISIARLTNAADIG